LEDELEDAERDAVNAADALIAGSETDAAAAKLEAEADIEILRLTPYLEKAKNAGTRAKAYYDFYN